MDFSQDEVPRGKRFERGQSSCGPKQGKEKEGSKRQANRGRGRPRQPTDNAEGSRRQTRWRK